MCLQLALQRLNICSSIKLNLEKSTQRHNKQPQVMKLREYQARTVFHSAALQQQTGWASLQTTKTAPILWA